jgi:hypothetical protein
MTPSPSPKLLRIHGCELAEEIRLGRWSHLKDLLEKPASACVELIDELKVRCPGYDLEEYEQALANGLFETR